MASASYQSADIVRDDYKSVNINLSSLLSNELQPARFYNIPIKNFGNSDTRKNPFMKLKAVAMNLDNPPEDRMRAIRYMDKIPHKDRVMHALEATTKAIIEDDRIPIGERYFFFSNNEKICKLSADIVKGCHAYYFQTAADHKDWNPILRILSASYIYCSELHYQPIWTQVREFLIKTAQDPDNSVHMRSEAADVLSRLITREDRNIGMAVINELGDLYSKNKMGSIYTNAQNAHNDAISDSVMNIIRHLIAEHSKERRKTENIDPTTTSSDPIGFASRDSKVINTGDIYDRISKLVESFSLQRKTNILAAFNMIMINPARYEGITLSDVLSLVWAKINTQPETVKLDLEQRMLEELYEMNDTCATGLCSRIVNVLSGYIEDENLQIKMNVKDQLRANIFARFQVALQRLPQKQQEEILDEITEDTQVKSITKEFIETYSVRDELLEEFVDAELMSEEDFNVIYEKCIKDFMGIA